MPATAYQCIVPSIMPLRHLSTMLTFDPLQVEGGVISGMITVCILALRILTQSPHKADRAATLLIVWGMTALILGENDVAVPVIAFGVGCAVAATARAPYWLWRAVGNRDRLCMGLTVAIGLLAVIWGANFGAIHGRDLMTTAILGCAAVLFIIGENQWSLPVIGNNGSSFFLLGSGCLLLSLRGSAPTTLPVTIILLAACLLRQATAVRRVLYNYRSRHDQADQEIGRDISEEAAASD